MEGGGVGWGGGEIDSDGAEDVIGSRSRRGLYKGALSPTLQGVVCHAAVSREFESSFGMLQGCVIIMVDNNSFK